MKLTKSKNFVEEYSATIVKIGDITPIENSDFLATTIVAGYDIVIRKDQVKPGDILVYCPIETKINSNFLAKNNLYSNTELNTDNNIKGYFNSNGRVRIIKLRSKPSMGVLFSINDFKTWLPTIDINDFTSNVGTSFDTVDDNLFIKVFMPESTEQPTVKGNRRQNKVKNFDRIIPGTFFFHYDTAPLNRNMDRIKPDDIITITEKVHGTSFILSNIPTKVKLNIFKKIINFICHKYKTIEYNVIYSSRNVIKNKYINKTAGPGYYSEDIYKFIAEKFGKYIDQNFTVYGECVGYEPGSSRCIQKKGKKIFNYGCPEGQFKIMPYRITKLENGVVKEYNVDEVNEFTNLLIKILKSSPFIFEQDLTNWIMPMNLFYHGKASDLYPELDINTHWQENFLEKLKQDKKFYMEQDEPTCPKGVPSEGIVIRIDDDKLKEAFKLKCLRFLEAEAKDVDAGNIDSESVQKYN